MFEQLLTEATKFFATHAKFIIGAIVNLIIIIYNIAGGINYDTTNN